LTVRYNESKSSKEVWTLSGSFKKISENFLRQTCTKYSKKDDKADFDGERTPFALTVGDADNIDRFDVYRIYETLHKNNFKDMDISLKKDYVKKRLNELYKLLNMELGTKSAEELWKERLVFYIEFYEKLKEQLKISEDVF